ncbi:ras-related C3 botulinum toxin substrate 1-like [Condylostylus longicornis]|uniref:ras-related C3 botulinum toxin substrate 1-like n=1 Tax=Condylostylus longicornis TaxID=2530218 RepID=UPI00244E3458|nr:ras-related C3 botulinum toxin substrate 1-like [Condylostylus longicornis]
MNPNKCILVGDSKIGKSSLIITYSIDIFPDVIPNVFGEYSKFIVYDEKTINLEMWDSCALEEYNRLRPISYPFMDVFLICFSVVDRNSYKRVKEKWYPEVHLKHSKTPIILVGTKTDLRNDDNIDDDQECVTYSEGVEMANQIGATNYYECSALKKIGLEEIFNEVARLIVYPPKT